VKPGHSVNVSRAENGYIVVTGLATFVFNIDEFDDMMIFLRGQLS
jgi:hypothetical protein